MCVTQALGLLSKESQCQNDALCLLQLDVLFGNLGEMVEFQVEFLRTLEDGIRLVPNLDQLERVEQFKARGVRPSLV